MIKWRWHESNWAMVAALAVISLFLSLLYCPPFDVGISDKEIFRYAGWAISRGLVPYRDFFDHKPPLIYFVYYVGLAAGGPWGLWFISALLALLATVMLYRCCRNNRIPFSWFPPLLFNLLLRNFLVSNGINMTREYTAYLYIFFFCILLSNARHRYYLLGLIGGLGFFMQQEQALALMPFYLFALFRIDRPTPGRRIAFMAAGFFTVLLPLLGYFAFHHALSDFWQQAFLFNWQTYTSQHKSFRDHFRSIKRVLDLGNYEPAVMVSLVLAIAALSWESKKKGLILAALGGMLLSMSPEFLGGRFNGNEQTIDYGYYFLPLAAGTGVLLITVFAFGDRFINLPRMASLPLILLTLCSPGYTDLQHAGHLVLRRGDPILNSPELNYLRDHRPADYELYVFMDDDFIAAYYELRTLAPSRWIYQHFWSWYEGWDRDSRILQSICQDLTMHHTRYVITNHDKEPGFRNPESRRLWMNYLTSQYEPVPMPGQTNTLLWQLKPLQ